MTNEIILNRIEKEIQEQEKHIDYCNNMLKNLSHPEDIEIIKKNKQETLNILYILRKLKKYKNVPLKVNYIRRVIR